MPNLNERKCNCGASVVACRTVQLHLKTCEFLAEHLIHWGCANIYEVVFFMLHNADPLCAFEGFIQYFSVLLHSV